MLKYLAYIALTKAILLDKQSFDKINVREILEQHKEFNQDVFDKLLTRNDLDHILLSDVTNLMYSLQEDYPELVEVKKIGESWEKRPINLLTLDAYEYLKSSSGKYEKELEAKKNAKAAVDDDSFVELDEGDHAVNTLVDKMLATITDNHHHHHHQHHKHADGLHKKQHHTHHLHEHGKQHHHKHRHHHQHKDMASPK